MSEMDPDKLADELEDQADGLQQHSEQLGEQTSDVRQDWERKRSDPQIAGANPPDTSEEEDPEEGTQDRGADPQGTEEEDRENSGDEN
jgi:hypothetical protein